MSLIALACQISTCQRRFSHQSNEREVHVYGEGSNTCEKNSFDESRPPSATQNRMDANPTSRWEDFFSYTGAKVGAIFPDDGDIAKGLKGLRYKVSVRRSKLQLQLLMYNKDLTLTL